MKYSNAYKILRSNGIYLSPEKYGNQSFLTLALKALKLWKNEILHKIARNSVILSPAPISARLIRPFLHRLRGVEIGKNCLIGINVIFDSVYPEKIKIGNYVQIANGCHLIAHYRDLTNHGLDEKKILDRNYIVDEILIDDDVLIGVGCILLAGIKIGRGSVIAAGSVVNKSVQPYTLVGGSPAKVIKKFGDLS